MSVYIENLQDKMEISPEMKELLLTVVASSLLEEKFDIPAEVSILLVDNAQIREINYEQREIDKPTDVLSFPLIEMKEGEILSSQGDMDLDKNLLLLGDIVISMEMVKMQSEEYGHSFERELAFLASHGMFHLLGYDHQTPEEERNMMEKQEKVLHKMQLGR